jgi:paraquat-inducible protein A
MSIIIIALPAFFVGVVSWLAISIKMAWASPRSIKLLRVIAHLRFWNMAEIFFLGILISMVKVSSMVDVEVGVSFWAYALFNVFLIAALGNIDRFQLTQAIKQIVRKKQESAGEH